MLPNSGFVLWRTKPVLKRQVLVGKERLLYSGGWQPGDKADLYSKTKFKDSVQPWKFYIYIQLYLITYLLLTVFITLLRIFSSCTKQFSSVQFSFSVVSNSLQPHEPQHTRPPCSSPTPRVHPNPCPLCRFCHPTISSSVIPFSSCPQSFPASGSFQMSQVFASGGQSIGVSASTSVLPMNTQDWSPLRWTDWISLQSKGLSGVFSPGVTLSCKARTSHSDTGARVSGLQQLWHMGSVVAVPKL